MNEIKDFEITILKQDIDKFLHNKNYLIISVCNYGYLRIVKNWVRYLKKLNIPNYLIFCLDKRLYDRLVALNINAYHVKTQKSFLLKSQIHRSHGFNMIVYAKIMIVYELLKTGFDILLSDADTIWLKDPMEYIATDGFDLQMQSDARAYDRNQPLLDAYFNTGLYYVKSNAKTMKLFEKVIIDMANAKLKDDQVSFNAVIRNEGGGIELLPPDFISPQDGEKISIRMLDPLQFPNGAIYFYGNNVYRKLNINPIIIHANFFNQVEKKIEAIRSAGYWHFESKGERILWRMKSFVRNIWRNVYRMLKGIKVLRDIKRKFSYG